MSKQVLEYQIVQIYGVPVKYLISVQKRKIDETFVFWPSCIRWEPLQLLAFVDVHQPPQSASQWPTSTGTTTSTSMSTTTIFPIYHPRHWQNWKPQLPSVPWKMSVLWQSPLIWSLPQLLWWWWTLSAPIWLKLRIGWPKDKRFQMPDHAALCHLCLCNA